MDENEDGYYEALRADAVFVAFHDHRYVATALLARIDEGGNLVPLLVGRESPSTSPLTSLPPVPTTRDGHAVSAVAWFDGEEIWETGFDETHDVVFMFNPIDDDGASVGSGGRGSISMAAFSPSQFGRLPVRILGVTTVLDAETPRVDVLMLVRRREPVTVTARFDGPHGPGSAVARFEGTLEPGEITLPLPLEFDESAQDQSWRTAIPSGLLKVIQNSNVIDSHDVGSSGDD